MTTSPWIMHSDENTAVRGMDAGTVRERVRVYRRTGDRRYRNEIVEAHLHLVDHYVALHVRPGVASRDDLRQTALLALIRAVDRFDPDAGASLSTFATRTIDGELKRYLRDRTWMVRPPRSAQETHLHVRRATEELSHALRRAPTVPELATHLGIDEEKIIVGLVAGQARVNESFDRPRRDDDGASSAEVGLGVDDERYELCDSLMSLRDGMARLDDRQREILRMRFDEDLSQSDIAEVIGVSQSYVSRILQSALVSLRADFT